MPTDLFKNYKPEILIYNPEVNGSYEHKIRNEHLSTKEQLLNKVRKAKADAKGNQTRYRQPIRTENEKS